MTENILCAIIGIVGTITGTIIGWLLNGLSQHGRLKLFVAKWENVFKRNDECGYCVTCTSKGEAQYYQYDLVLDIYNSSGETQIVRDFELHFLKGKEEVWKSIPQDDATKRQGGHLLFYDDISSFNVPPKTIITLKLHSGLWNSDPNFNKLFDVDKVLIDYENKNRRKKKFVVNKGKMSNFFNI